MVYLSQEGDGRDFARNKISSVVGSACGREFCTYWVFSLLAVFLVRKASNTGH